MDWDDLGLNGHGLLLGSHGAPGSRRPFGCGSFSPMEKPLEKSMCCRYLPQFTPASPCPRKKSIY